MARKEAIVIKTIRAGMVAIALAGFAVAGAIPVEAATYSPAPGVHITVHGPSGHYYHRYDHRRFYHPRHRERVCWHTWRHHHRVLVCTWRWR
jgi:hypothetical protein